jgi:CDP-diacylglycerol--serine O-phosphatidyltransferase
MGRREKMIAVFPTLLTLGNAACGFGAITIAAKVGPYPAENQAQFTLLFYSALLVFLGMVFDALDGRAARWAKQTSEFGAELDSLCDAITFGVAPAFLMLKFAMPLTGPHGALARMLWVIAALFVVCVLLRLARFNVETEEDDSHEFFSGLPSPAAAGVVCSFPVALHGLAQLSSAEAGRYMARWAEWLIPTLQITLPAFTLAAACLMVSRVRYPHVFNQLFRGRRNRQHILQLVFTLAVIFMAQELALPLVFCFFAFAAPLKSLWLRVFAPRFGKSVANFTKPSESEKLEH